MPMYNVIEYIDNYLSRTGNLWQYYKDQPNNPINDSTSFKFNTRFLAKTKDRGS